MKNISSSYKENVKLFGRQIDSKITYELDDEEIELGAEELNSVTPHYEGSILKSVMKQLDIDSNVEIPIGSVINYQFGVKVDNGYEYINCGNYVVYKSEKQEDTKSWKLTCYDKMLYSMVPYESLNVTYPITVKNLLVAICEYMGVEFANENDNFVNSDKQITSELYLDGDGNSLDYTFRDVLDELAQVTASVICINDEDKLEIRYVNNTGEYETVEGTELSLENVDDKKDIEYILKGNTSQNGTPTPDTPVEVQTVTGSQIIDVLGKNIANINETIIGKSWSNTSNTNRASILYIPIKTGSQYSLVYSYTNENITQIRGVLNKGSLDQTSNLVVNGTFTVDSGWTYISIEIIANTTFTSSMLEGTKIMLCKGSATIDDYEDYKGKSYEINLGNIELCEIGNYQDKIYKGSGINLLDTSTAQKGYYVTNSISASSNWYIQQVPVKPNTSYYLSGNNRNNTNAYIVLLDSSKNIISSLGSYPNVHSITTTDNTAYIGVSIADYEGTADMNTIMINEGTTALSYEPYNSKGKWLLHKEIGKYNINTTQITLISSYSNIEYANIPKPTDYAGYNLYDHSEIKSNSATWMEIAQSGWNTSDNINKISGNADKLKWWLGFTKGTGLTAIKSALSSSYILYRLATPIITEITDIDLLNQLNSVELLEGLNNISVISSNLSSPLNLTYLSELDMIDEEYLKDVNVNFGEKFGPVNAVVLSRSAESDNIYQRDEASVESNGICEVKIKDNQILNGNNRDEFLPEIFNKLNGLEYYLTDFTSTGITFYDLLDRYKVKVEDNYYKTIMFNDEIDVTQGLEEQVYANELEESETDYTKSDKTDRRINQAYIIVDKQNQQINSVVQSINTLQNTVNEQGEQVEAIGTRVTQTIDNITASVSNIQDTLDNGVNLVKTTSVTINDEGLSVSTDTSKIKTTMTNNEFKIVDSSNTTLAKFGYDEEEQISVATMDNLTVENYFVAGYHRTEKMEADGEHRTGVFYIGG